MNTLEMNQMATLRLEQLRSDAAEANRSQVLLRGWRSRVARVLNVLAVQLEPELRSIASRTSARA